MYNEQHQRPGQNMQPTNNNQFITHCIPGCYLLRIQQYPVNSTYSNIENNNTRLSLKGLSFFNVSGCMEQIQLSHMELCNI